MERSNPRRGSALFIILIGVVLFAALSYVVAEMMRGGDPGMITQEKAKLYANEILNVGRALRQAAQNIKISNGCADKDISVEDSQIPGYTHLSAAPDKCKIFMDGGGGMIYVAPSNEWLDMTISPAPALRGNWYFPADVCVPGTGTAPAGVGCNADSTDNEAIIAVLPYVRKEVCVAINDLLGVTNPGGAPPSDVGNAWKATADKYAGAQTDGERIDVAAQAGCFEGAAASTPPLKTYHFYQIMVPR